MNAQPARRNPLRASQSSFVERLTGETPTFWLWTASLFYMTAPFEIILTGSDPDRGGGGGLPTYNYSRFVVGLIAAGLAFRNSEKASRIIRSIWPYLGFLAVEAVLSIRGGDQKSAVFATIALSGGIFTTISAAAAMSTERFAKSALYVLALTVIASILAVVLIPSVAIHSGLDITGGAGRKGEWRGAYLHKNYLGHISGITFAMIACFGALIIKTRLYAVAICAAAMICAIFSHSSSALVLCISGPAIYYAIVSPRGFKRWASYFAIVVCLVVVLPYQLEISTFLLGLVGKSPTLSGRTEIWRIALDAANKHPIFGGGLGYTTSSDFSQQLVSGFGVSSVHNAYLDTLINFGYLGSLIFAGILAWIVFSAWVRRMDDVGQRTRNLFTTLFALWLVSGLTEIMAVRTYGPIAEVGLIAIVGLGSVAGSRAIVRSPRPNRKADLSLVSSKEEKSQRATSGIS